MAGGQKGQDNDGMGFAISIGALVGLCFLLFYLFHNEIIRFAFYFKAYELKFISGFSPHYYVLLNWVNSIPKNQVTLTDLSFLSLDIGDALKWPVVAVSLCLMGCAYLFHPDTRFKGDESMESLRKKMDKQFTSIHVVADYDLVTTPVDKGPFAMGLTPIEFAKKHKLLSYNKKKEIQVDSFKSKTLFTKQLGRLWIDVVDLAPYEQALFVAFCMYSKYEREKADAYLSHICASCNKETMGSQKLDFGDLDALVAKYKDIPEIQPLLKEHAYVTTIFIALLEQARTSGIVANSSYLWLKVLDRRLWYVLNNVGRKAVFTETGAVHGHYLSEKALGVPLTSPMVDEAVSALEEAIASRVIKSIT
jgi:intracellular multiplication protein IcmP